MSGPRYPRADGRRPRRHPANARHRVKTYAYVSDIALVVIAVFVVLAFFKGWG